ncbi:uncharacterized protein ACLA_092230 [Aspergillus clavatus NRRL 1]|uniref:Uncharacterized protein n=1 Tax=Aspergillus clavatus (strain ATCC 1007 / CBS 513.65 / DSM 816 / NCTC 3887 / NRRL 1 / QM 1276 / 107) TaxID=344612 RepID=A1CF76_ASPCL|nr:uncharacterized protein ACLA_092230 [Aspergillus clavatus NRRL 1]EAW11525.1 hypothetical protein ACLA_092230 [Aspergillus clavatus NRRL 1]
MQPGSIYAERQKELKWYEKTGRLSSGKGKLHANADSHPRTLSTQTGTQTAEASTAADRGCVDDLVRRLRDMHRDLTIPVARGSETADKIAKPMDGDGHN